MHNEQLHDLQSLPNTRRMIKKIKMRYMGHVAHIGAKRKAYRFLMGKHERKRLLGRPKHRRDYKKKK